MNDNKQNHPAQGLEPIPSTKPEIPLNNYHCELIINAVKRMLNMHPDDDDSAIAAMRYIANKEKL